MSPVSLLFIATELLGPMLPPSWYTTSSNKTVARSRPVSAKLSLLLMSAKVSPIDARTDTKISRHTMSDIPRDPEPTRKKQKRQRSTYACAHCRAKKRKCDQQRPICSYCLKHNRNGVCEYKDPAISTVVNTGVTTGRSGGVGLFSGTNGKGKVLRGSRSSVTVNNKGDNSVQRTLVSPLIVREGALGSGSASSEQPQFHINRQCSNGQWNSSINFSETFLANNGNANSPKLDETSPEFLQAKIIEFQNKLALLCSKDGQPRDYLSPNINEFEVIDFFAAGLGIFFKSNNIVDYKPLDRGYMCLLDPLFYGVLKFVGGHYRVIKSALKESELDSDIYYLMNPLSTLALKDDFNVKNYILMGNCLLDRKSSYYEHNAKLIAALCSSKNSKNGFALFSATSKDFCERVIAEIESKLPKLKIILFLWSVYEKYVYPFVPVLDLQAFKKDIELVITGVKLNASALDDPIAQGNTDYKIYITSFTDLGIIAIFLIILRLSYLAVKINLDIIHAENEIVDEISNPNQLEFISSDYILLAFSCLSQCKTMKKASFVTLSAYIHLFYYYSTCEETPNSIVGKNRHILYDNIFSFATSIGLYYDWEDIVIEHVSTGLMGVNVERNNLLNLARRLWHYVKRIDAILSVETGYPTSIHIGKKVKLPNSETQRARTGSEQSSENNVIVDKLIDENYVSYDKITAGVRLLMRLIYEVETCRVKELHSSWVQSENLLHLEFANPEEYFSDNGNFIDDLTRKSGLVSSPKDHNYYLVLNKVLKFKRYVFLSMQNFKVLMMLYFHYEQTENMYNYYYYLKQALSSTVTTTRFLILVFIVGNKKFLLSGTEGNADLRFFNHAVLREVENLVNQNLVFLFGLTLRLFNIIYRLHLQLKACADPVTAPQIQQKISIAVNLKESLIKLSTLVTHAYYEKVSKYYFYMLKDGFIYRGLLKAIRRHTDENSRGEPTSVLSILFGLREQIKNLRNTELMNQHITKAPSMCLLMNYSAGELGNLFKMLQLRPLAGASSIASTPTSNNIGDGARKVSERDLLAPLLEQTGDWVDELNVIVENDHMYKTFSEDVTFSESRDLFLQQLTKPLLDGAMASMARSMAES